MHVDRECETQSAGTSQYAEVAELADAHVWGACGVHRTGSSPVFRINDSLSFLPGVKSSGCFVLYETKNDISGDIVVKKTVKTLGKFFFVSKIVGLDIKWTYTENSFIIL